MSAEKPGIEQNVVAGRDAYVGSRGAQVGDANIQINLYGRPTASGPLVAGDVPQATAAFQPREDLLARLRSAGPGVSVVRAVTGLAGVGKTQLAAAYARECIDAGWRLVAWVNAQEMSEVLSRLAAVASRLGIAEPTDSGEAAGQRLRYWLEAGGEQCLLVFDNVADPDALRPYIPAAGRSQVVLTGTSMLLGVLGRSVSVDVFTEEEALAFLAERTGLNDPRGARALAAELGFLPLGLAQAAAVIVSQHLGYESYLERLRSVPQADYLGVAEGESYPNEVAKAILLSMAQVTASDSTGLSEELLDLIAVLSPQGVSRDLLYRAARTGALRGGRGASRVNEAIGRLVQASLLSLSADDDVVAHPLVARVVRERKAAVGTLPAVVAGACALLEDVTGRITEPALQKAEVLDAVAHITALSEQVEPVLRDDDPVALRLLVLRDWALRGLLELGDGAAQAITVGQSLASDSALLLGEEHPDTLARQNDLAIAYQIAGRPADAASLFERVARGRESVLGPDHPDTLAALGNLGLAYQDMGRPADAASLFKRVARGRESVLGPDHPDTLAALGNLGLAYQGLGRPADAASLFERVARGRELVLGPDHPGTLAALGNLALAYQGLGRAQEATSLLERVLVGRDRVLGPEHPDTLAARSNLALAFQGTGRLGEAIPLFEQALAGLERVLGPDDPLTVAVRRNLADARKEVRGQPRVFISHARNPRQTEIAGKLEQALRPLGLEVINTRDEIALGTVWAPQLRDLAGSADVTLVLVTEHGIESEWVRTEAESALRRAQAGESVVIPVFLGKAPPPKSLPYGLATRQGIILNPDGARSYVAVARQVAEVAARARRPARHSLAPPAGTPAGQLAAAELLELSQLVTAAFRAAGRQLRATGQPQLLEPGPVWISAERVPSARELDRFSGQVTGDSVGYFVHVGDLPRDTDEILDHMRVGGKRVVTVSERALRAALADGRTKVFLSELEQLYCGRDNQFDTKNALIDDRFFFGRDAILTTIGGAIKRDEHILISGLRKVGKTSLLNILRLQLADKPVCQVDLELFDRNGEEWPLELFGLIVKAVDGWGRLGHEEWPFTFTQPASATELARQLEERFDYAGGDPAGQRVVVMLDEIERVFPKRGEAEATRRWIRAVGALRALAQGGRRYVVVIGADLRPIANRENDLGNGETNPFFSFFQEVPIALLDGESTGEMLRTIARASGIDTVSADLIDTLFGLTGGHPSLARWIAAEAYRQRRDPGRMDLVDLRAGLASMEDDDSVGSFIRTNLWQPMTAAEKQVAAMLARNRLIQVLASFPKLRGGPQLSGPALNEARASLRSQGIAEGGTIRIGLLWQWVRDNASA